MSTPVSKMQEIYKTAYERQGGKKIVHYVPPSCSETPYNPISNVCYRCRTYYLDEYQFKTSYPVSKMQYLYKTAYDQQSGKKAVHYVPPWNVQRSHTIQY